MPSPSAPGGAGLLPRWEREGYRRRAPCRLRRFVADEGGLKAGAHSPGTATVRPGVCNAASEAEAMVSPPAFGRLCRSRLLRLAGLDHPRVAPSPHRCMVCGPSSATLPADAMWNSRRSGSRPSTYLGSWPLWENSVRGWTINNISQWPGDAVAVDGRRPPGRDASLLSGENLVCRVGDFRDFTYYEGGTVKDLEHAVYESHAARPKKE